MSAFTWFVGRQAARSLPFVVFTLLAAPFAAHAQSDSPRGLRPNAHPRTLTLDDAFGEALQNSVDLRITQQSITQSEATVRRAWAAVLPQINLSADYTFNLPEQKASFGSVEQNQQQALLFNSIANLTEQSAQFSADPTAKRAAAEQAEALRASAKALGEVQPLSIIIQPGQVATGALTLSMPIFSARAIPGIQSAYAGISIARLASTQARAQVLYGVARAYYQVVAAKKIVEIAKQQAEGAAHHRDVAKQRLQEGAVTALAVERADLDSARAEQQVRAATGALKIGKGALGNMIGATEDFDVSDPPVVAAIEQGQNDDGLYERALTARPDIQLQKESLKIADRNRLDAWLRLLPSLNLNVQGRYTSNTSGFTTQPFSGAVIFQAQLPIFDGGQTWAAIEDTNAALKKELLRVHQLEESIMTNVHGALDDIELKKDVATTAERVLALAKSSRGNADRLFELGAATSLDVLDASNSEFSAGVDATRAKLDLETARLGLAFQLGELTPRKDISIPDVTADEESHARALADRVGPIEAGPREQAAGENGTHENGGGPQSAPATE